MNMRRKERDKYEKEGKSEEGGEVMSCLTVTLNSPKLCIFPMFRTVIACLILYLYTGLPSINFFKILKIFVNLSSTN